MQKLQNNAQIYIKIVSKSRQTPHQSALSALFARMYLQRWRLQMLLDKARSCIRVHTRGFEQNVIQPFWLHF